MSLIFNGVAPKEIKYNGTDLTVLKYSVKESDLSGEATRASVASYSKASLDGYVGLVNDTWGGITNASSLSRDKYYYIRVLVTDTNRYGKFCIRHKTAESPTSQTITVDNMGWGYDGEVIAAIPVWGKPLQATISKDSNILLYTIYRTDSPNAHAASAETTGGGIDCYITTDNNTIYYGDLLELNAKANDHYKPRINFNGSISVGNEGEILQKKVVVKEGNYIAFTSVYVPYMHTLWTGSYSVQAKNQKITANWPVTLPGGVTSVSINVNFSFRGKNVSGTYTVNNNGTNASAFIKYNGVSKTTMTISWKNNSQFYFESTGNSYYATATISSISCVY